MTPKRLPALLLCVSLVLPALASARESRDARVDLTGLRYSYRGGLLLMEDKAEAKKRGLEVNPMSGAEIDTNCNANAASCPPCSQASRRVCSISGVCRWSSSP